MIPSTLSIFLLLLLWPDTAGEMRAISVRLRLAPTGKSEMFIPNENPIELAKEMVWLAWQASVVTGLGVLQDRPQATREDVWSCVWSDDYPSCVDADYVFGRMMKLYMRIQPDGVSIPDGGIRSDYQSWNYKYDSHQALVDAALAVLNSPIPGRAGDCRPRQTG